MQIHGRAKLGPAGRLALTQAVTDGMTLRQAAGRFGVSVATAHGCGDPGCISLRRNCQNTELRREPSDLKQNDWPDSQRRLRASCPYRRERRLRRLRQASPDARGQRLLKCSQRRCEQSAGQRTLTG
jgi:hypothetical protein